MNKCYVRVEIFIDTDGVIIPTKILWDDGRQWDIKKVLHTCVCLLYTSPSPRDRTRSRMPSSA